MDIVQSVNEIPIRLTRERWFHITENHDDLAGYYDDLLDTVEKPDSGEHYLILESLLFQADFVSNYETTVYWKQFHAWK